MSHSGRRCAALPLALDREEPKTTSKATPQMYRQHECKAVAIADEWYQDYGF